MKITVELSLYPFNSDYKTLIKDFIAALNKQDGLVVNTTLTSTMIHGDYDVVMDSLKSLIAWSYETHGPEVFVAKFIPGHEVSD
jgi:uncharacterized protein YqgV (UPF0045/DUF77 family)